MMCDVGRASCGDAAGDQRNRRAHQHAVGPVGATEAGRGRQTTETPDHPGGGDAHPHGRESVRMQYVARVQRSPLVFSVTILFFR